MPVKLPVECWLDTFRHLSKPTLGLRIALCSRHFNGIVNLRILGSESERTIDKLLIFEEQLWIDTNGTSRQVPVPECLPPWNVHFKSITVFGALGPCTAKLLRLLTSSTSTVNRHQQPSVVLQLDGSSRFAQHCGPRAWLNNANIRRLVLAKRSSQRFCPDDNGGGPSLFQIFTVQSLLLRLLEIPTLECHLSEPDYNRHLLNWLQTPLPFEHREPSSSPHHFDCQRQQQQQHRLLILKGEAPNIQQFLRDARQHFSRAMAPLGYRVEIETNEPLVTGWTDYNFMNGELLSLQPAGPKKVKKTTGSNFRHFYSLQCHQSAKCRHHHQSRRSAHIEEELLMMDGEGDGDGERMMTTGRRWPAGESREDCNEANVLTISFA